MAWDLFVPPHRTRAKSKWSSPLWAPTIWSKPHHHDTRTSGGLLARGLASAIGGSLNAHLGAVLSPVANMIGVSLKLEHSSDFMAGLIVRALGDTVLPETLCGNDLKQWINMDACYIRIACMVKNGLLQELYCLVSDKELLFVRMDVGSSSSNPPFAPKPVEVKIKELKHDFKLL